MDKFSVIRDLALILALSLPVLFLFKRLKISPILGFLITGVLIGPSGLNIIRHNEQIEVMSEIGIILLMFTIGLEFSIAKLIRWRKDLLLYGGLQVMLSIIAGWAAMQLLGLSFPLALFSGMLFSISSTTIVLRLLTDNSLLDAPHGRISVAVSIFQDLAVLPMLIILPVFGTGSNFNALQFLLKILSAIVLLAVMITISRFVIPVLLKKVAALRMREMFTAAMVVLVFGTAYIAHAAGLSFSIGVFIAGFIIAESEYSYEILAEITPFKDIFNSIFFVAAGLLLSLTVLQEHLLMVLGLTFSAILVKFLLVSGIVRATGYPMRTALISGLLLSQIGEFAFVLAQEGLKYSVIDAEYYNIFLSVSVLSMFITPVLFTYVPAMIKGKNNPDTIAEEKLPALNNHVIIVGYGLNGKNLSTVLKETGIPYIIVELNPETVNKLRQANEKVVFGDITKREILYKAGIKTAKSLVFAISDPLSAKLSLRIAKEINPSVYTIVRTRYVTEIPELTRLGANSVIPEEFETSLQIFTKVLGEYHIPTNVIMRQINMIRQTGYELLTTGEVSLDAMHLMDIISRSVTETYFVENNSGIIGVSLKELDLRAKCGASILAIVRGEQPVNNPSGSEVMRYADVLVLTGTHEAVDKAVNLMNDYGKESTNPS